MKSAFQREAVARSGLTSDAADEKGIHKKEEGPGNGGLPEVRSMEFVIRWTEYTEYRAVVNARSEKEVRALWELGDLRVWDKAEISGAQVADDSPEVVEAV
jgi:hypothetical protein